jgi:phenylacetate-CoA ligase
VDHTAVRVVDRDGHPVAPGSRGEIVISNLTNRASVVLNYRLGDIVTLGAQPCACGRTLPTIEGVDGRADDFIVLEDGRRMHALVALAPLLRVRGVVQVQLVQEDPHRGVLRVVCAAGRAWSSVQHDLGLAWRSTLGDALALRIERTDAIAADAGGKVKAVISTVP